MAVMSSFHAEKCYHLVSAHAASARHPLTILSTVPGA